MIKNIESVDLHEIPMNPEELECCFKCKLLLKQVGNCCKIGSISHVNGKLMITWEWFCGNCSAQIADFMGCKVENVEDF